jgi:hypothetical protein
VGELRGSGRLWDGLKARGERQAALAAARRFAADAQDLGYSYRTGLSAAVDAETARRQRLSVAVPSLSPEALTRLRQLEAVRRADWAGYSTGAAQLMGHVRLQAEIEAFTRALERRFGEHDFTRGVAGAERSVAAGDQARLENLSPTLAAVQRVAQEQSHVRSLSFNRSRSRGLSDEGVGLLENGVGMHPA